MKIVIQIFHIFKLDFIKSAEALLHAEIDRRCSFRGPISPDLEPLSRAVDCFAKYREGRHA